MLQKEKLSRSYAEQVGEAKTFFGQFFFLETLRTRK
jgi:hypothetical protein